MSFHLEAKQCAYKQELGKQQREVTVTRHKKCKREGLVSFVAMFALPFQRIKSGMQWISCRVVSMHQGPFALMCCGLLLFQYHMSPEKENNAAV